MLTTASPNNRVTQWSTSGLSLWGAGSVYTRGPTQPQPGRADRISVSGSVNGWKARAERGKNLGSKRQRAEGGLLASVPWSEVPAWGLKPPAPPNGRGQEVEEEPRAEGPSGDGRAREHTAAGVSLLVRDMEHEGGLGATARGSL